MAEILFAGHSATFIDCDGYKIAIDPWLKDNPQCPDNLKSPDKIDLIVLTHGHSDHASQAAELAIETGASLIATFELAVHMIQAGVPESQVLPMNKGGSITCGPVSISLTHAFHSNSFDTASGTRYAGEACGVIVKSDSYCIYHAGDTALFSDMRLIAESYQPDIALLPIGDRFTMGPREAALAAKMLSIGRVIPIHYKTFPLLTGTAQQFANHLRDLAPNCQMLELEPGQSFKL